MRRAASSLLFRSLRSTDAAQSLSLDMPRLYSTKPVVATMFPGDGECIG